MSRMILREGMKNEEVLAYGYEFGVAGTSDGILWDGDLERVCEANNIKIGGYIIRNNDIEYDEITTAITNFKEGEEIGTVLLNQGGKHFSVPVFAGTEACSEINEEFDFNRLQDISAGENSEDMWPEVTESELNEFLKFNCREEGSFDKCEFINEAPRQGQAIEALKNAYDLCDYDRWQKLQDAVCKGEWVTLDWEKSMKIIDILYSVDIEVLDL